MLGYALSLLSTRPLRVSIGSSSILFPRQLFIPMHNGCCIRHHREHILAQGCPALSLPCLCTVFALSPCPFLPIDLLKSWQSLTPGHPQWPQLVYLQAHRGGTHTMVLGSQKSVLHASSYVCRTTCVFSFNSVYFFSCFLFPLLSSLYPPRRLLFLPQTGGCEL